MSHEIIIIKRGNQEEEAHHGGAWKIAFADFMTAMMALFLVLWLINAANEETKRAVASYFNPVKLVDRNRSSKGVEEQKGGPTSQPGDANCEVPVGLQTKDPSLVNENSGSAVHQAEAAFFADPYASIEAIQRDDTHVVNGGRENELRSLAYTPNFSDPFMPPKQGHPSEAFSQKESRPFHKAEDLNGYDEKISVFRPEVKTTQKENKDKIDFSLIQKSIFMNLRESSIDSNQIEGSIEVTPTKSGILISIKDMVDRPMFEIGSSIPAPAMVHAVKAIAKTLVTQNGRIRISGHTDARIFEDEVDGNWRLSTERARSTYFILLDGGLPDSRIFEISGFADRNLKRIHDPFSGENRRIEIVLEQP